MNAPPPPAIEWSTVAAGHRSGGDLAVDERRGLVLTADRAAGDAAAGPDGARPSISIVSARTGGQRPAIAFGPAGPLPAPVPSGLDLDPASGVVVTSNSAASSITIADTRGRPPAPAADHVPVGAHPYGVELDPGRGVAYVASYGEHRIDVVDLRRRVVVDRIEGLHHPTELAFDDARDRLYVGNADRAVPGHHHLTVVELRSRRILRRLPVDANSRPAVDERTGVVYAASFMTGRIAEIAPGATRVARTIETGTTPHGVGVDGHRGLLYAPNLLANTVSVISVASGAVVATVPVEGAPLGVDVDTRTGRAWISLRDRSSLVALRLRGPAGRGLAAPPDAAGRQAPGTTWWRDSADAATARSTAVTSRTAPVSADVAIAA